MSEKHENLNVALIATIQKSGTWYTNNVLRCLELLINRPELYHQQNQLREMIKHELAQGILFEKSKHSSRFGLNDLFICHTICPGFELLLKQHNLSHADKWEATRFHLWGYNWGEGFIRQHQKWELLAPQNNPNTRIIYLYRNPLDHLVSFYLHAINHKDRTHRFMLSQNDMSEIPITSLQQFMFEAGGVGSYIKHYYTFYHMEKYFPQQIKLISYEDLINQPKINFAQMFSFIGMELDQTQQSFLNLALDICSRSSMKTIENELKHSIVRDQLGEGKHVRDGSIGQWIENLTDDDLQEIESIFNYFDLSINHFIADFPSSNISTATKQSYQNKFLDLQKWLSKNKISIDIPEDIFKAHHPGAELKI